MNLDWQEATKTISVALVNDASDPLKVEGIQTSAGLYVVSYPQTVAPGRSAPIELFYQAVNATGDLDVIRLLTNQGDKEIQVYHPRQQVVQLSANTLTWTVGEEPAVKTIAFTVNGGTVTPKSAKAYGHGNSAAVTSLGGGRYQLSITPASTAAAEQFPVVIDFDPKLPGVVVMVNCTVIPQG